MSSFEPTASHRGESCESSGHSLSAKNMFVYFVSLLRGQSSLNCTHVCEPCMHFLPGKLFSLMAQLSALNQCWEQQAEKGCEPSPFFAFLGINRSESCLMDRAENKVKKICFGGQLAGWTKDENGAEEVGNIRHVHSCLPYPYRHTTSDTLGPSSLNLQTFLLQLIWRKRTRQNWSDPF